ncbi:DUF192 domain-containing protein [Epibacterium ulvae]|uniref:DUF192 domain-containing protein n=1 Tax=Epibacterium ulvae TaxID=1156985 RepID=UPI00248FCC58|nr:DUF192 domain-containing protein [Epibacterium ulvae]
MCAAVLFQSTAVFASCRSDHVDLRGDWGQVGFSIELADTFEERARGLMFRESLPRGSGMLFVYEAPRNAQFWMKNTLIPLDMIFVDIHGTVQHVHENAVPGDLTAIDGGDDIYAVLEINGGLARTYGISKGSEIRHEVFSKNTPQWAC